MTPCKQSTHPPRGTPDHGLSEAPDANTCAEHHDQIYVAILESRSGLDIHAMLSIHASCCVMWCSFDNCPALRAQHQNRIAPCQSHVLLRLRITLSWSSFEPKPKKGLILIKTFSTCTTPGLLHKSETRSRFPHLNSRPCYCWPSPRRHQPSQLFALVD